MSPSPASGTTSCTAPCWRTIRRSPSFQAYVCGVPVMTQAARAEFIAAGLPEDEFFADAFVTRADLAAAGP